MNKINFAIIGCGRIAYKHVEAIVDNYENTNLIAVCDIDTQKAKEKADDYVDKMKLFSIELEELIIYEDYKELLKNEKIDAVAIATESGKHAQIGIDALNAGKHVIVEKPMALSTKDADEMIALGKKNGLKLCVCHQNRFNPPIQKLRQAIEEGRFGKIHAITARILWNRNENYYKQALWRGTYAQDGGCLMNQCIHNIDLLQWMMGKEIDDIHGIVKNFMHSYIEAEDYGSIQIQFKDGSIGNIEGTVNVFPQNLEETLSIMGEKGTVVIGGKAVNEVLVWEFADKKDNLEQIKGECNSEIENIYGRGHTPLYADFISSIYSDTKPLIDGEEGKKAMAIILHAYLSSKLKECVKFGKKYIRICENGIEVL